MRLIRPPVQASKNKLSTFQDIPDGLIEGAEGWDDLDRLARVRDDQARADYDAMRWRRALARARELPDGRIAVDLGLVLG